MFMLKRLHTINSGSNMVIVNTQEYKEKIVLSIYGLFYDAVSSLDHVVLKDERWIVIWVRYGMKWLWPNLWIQSRYMPGGIDGNYENLQSGYPALGSRFEPWNSGVRSRCTNCSAATFTAIYCDVLSRQSLERLRKIIKTLFFKQNGGKMM
jgi:hypothetical protein